MTLFVVSITRVLLYRGYGINTASLVMFVNKRGYMDFPKAKPYFVPSLNL